jgi:hypothetical protein
MKTIKIISIISLCIVCFFNDTQSQNLLKKNGGSADTSNVYQTGVGKYAKIGIGINSPKAKLQVKYQPSGDTATVRFDGFQQSGMNTTLVGSVANWLLYDGVYYGIYQTKGLNSTYEPKNYFQNNVGIGVQVPQYKLDINGIIGCTGDAATGMRIDNLGVPFVFQYHVRSSGLPDGDGDDGGSEPLGGDSATYSPLTLYSYGAKVQNYLECTGSTTTNGIIIKHNASVGSVLWCGNTGGTSAWTDPSVLKIYDGRVSIGADTTYADYKLAVNGKIRCREMKVTLSDWPDYVFGKNYHLSSLKDVEKYIEENNHLPEMPSAREVTEKGVDLGDMNARLVKKVEELTLYIISLQKEMDDLKAKIATR